MFSANGMVILYEIAYQHVLVIFLWLSIVFRHVIPANQLIFSTHLIALPTSHPNQGRQLHTSAFETVLHLYFNLNIL